MTADNQVFPKKPETERFEQEVTINLGGPEDPKPAEPALSGRLPPTSHRGGNPLQEFEDTIRASINSEITSLFTDYTLHCMSQTAACLVVLCTTTTSSSSKLTIATAAYFLCAAGFRPFVCFKIKQSKTKMLLASLDISRALVCGLAAVCIYMWEGKGVVGCF